jgi:membrane-associated protease RseP (regulator of RpoE activity)
MGDRNLTAGSQRFESVLTTSSATIHAMTNGAEEDENATRGQPTEPTEPAGAAAPAEAAPPPPPPDQGPSGAPPRRGGAWLVPKGVIAGLVGIVVVGIIFGSAFAIGRATAPTSESNRASNERPFQGRSPREPGGGPNLPGAPRQANGVFLGVATQPSTDPQGVQIVEVVNGSPAASAGLQADDVITAVDGTSVTRPLELAQQIRSHQSGDQVTIDYSRGGNPVQAQVTLADRSSSSQPNS